MPMPSFRPFCRSVAAAAAGFLAVIILAGCGGSDKLVPVEGTVKLGDEPLKTGSISFHPNAEAGNKAGQPATGLIENGRFKLMYIGKEGAPVGAYKVTVTSSVPSDPKDEYSTPKALLSFKLSDPLSTPLTAEVKAGGGPYDFKVTK